MRCMSVCRFWPLSPPAGESLRTEPPPAELSLASLRAARPFAGVLGSEMSSRLSLDSRLAKTCARDGHW